MHVMHNGHRISGARGSFLCLVSIVVIVAFYTRLTVKVLDNVNSHQNEDFHVTGGGSHQQAVTVLRGGCKKFDYGDQTPAQNVSSIFNCGSEESTCQYWYPAKFFDKKCGIGKEFNSQLKYMNDLFESKELWLSGPPIVLPWASIIPSKMRASSARTGLPWQRHNLSMIHVHKTGGSSLVDAFQTVRSLGATGKRHTMYMPGRIDGDKNRWTIKGAGYNESSIFLDGTTKYKREWGNKDHLLFAVVRDPAERFISAIGQATGATGSTGNVVGKTLLETCVNSNYPTEQECLRCFIDLVKQNSTWIEVHFTPMALEIAFATMYKDIPVAIFHFQEVPNLLIELGANPNKKLKDGHKPGYRKNPILTNMNVDHYDDEMLRDLCDIYRVDATFLRQVGIPSRCDEFL
jgi:hypothetical protein